MTSLTAASTAGRSQRRRSGSWRRLTWVTWRQHRGALTGFGALYAALALAMLLVGLKMHSAFHTLAALHCPVASLVGSRCATSLELFVAKPYDLYPNGVALALTISPMLIGVFLGAPLLAREYETGTLRFAWTQGTGRLRWAAVQVTLLATVIAATTCALAALGAWSWRPFAALGFANRWQAGMFGTTPVTAAGWALAAFALGTLLGAVIKRTVPAMAATAAVVTGLAVGAYWKLDYLLLSVHTKTAPDPAIVTMYYGQSDLNIFAQQAYPGPPGSWLVRGWFAGPTGHPLGPDGVAAVTRRLFGNKPGAALRWLAQRHDTFLVAYQPGGRYWLFQAVTGLTLLLFAAALIAATLLLIRRRHT
jgi:hypothetical protein